MGTAFFVVGFGVSGGGETECPEDMITAAVAF